MIWGPDVEPQFSKYMGCREAGGQGRVQFPSLGIKTSCPPACPDSGPSFDLRGDLKSPGTLQVSSVVASILIWTPVPVKGPNLLIFVSLSGSHRLYVI